MRELNFFENIPGYVYVFPEHLNGGKLFFKAAYDAKLALCHAQWGMEEAQLYCMKLILWRAAFHLLGGAAVALLIHHIRRLSGARSALAFSVVFAAFIILQEFVVQPRELNEIFFKSVFDSVAWLLPSIAYWALVLYRKFMTPIKQVQT